MYKSGMLGPNKGNGLVKSGQLRTNKGNYSKTSQIK